MYLLDTSLPSGGEGGQVSDIACQEGWGQKADIEPDLCDFWICEIVFIFNPCLVFLEARRQMSRHTSVVYDIWICEIVKDRSMILVIKTDMWYLLQLE